MVAGRFVALEVQPSVHRLELPASVLGLPAPPTYTELALQRGRDGWRVHALAGREQADGILRWLRALGGEGVAVVAGREPGVKARLAQLPAPLEFAHGLVGLRRVGAGSDGSAFLVAEASKARFDEVMRRLEAQRTPENAIPELTARQAELLQVCKDRGYYAVPRQATLRDIAADLGISPTALSRALRRAEARILSAYVERLRHSLPRAASGRAKRSP